MVHSTHLTPDIRVDSEYHQPIYLTQEAKIAALNSRPLSDLADVSDGNHMTISDKFTDSGVRYLRGQDLSSDFFISDANPVYIPYSEYEKLHRSHMKPGDVLLSVVGTIGSVAIVTDKYPHLTGSCKIAIIRPKRTNPYYLAAYLASEIGQGQIKRRIRGAVQQGLILPDLKELPVPVVGDRSVAEIEKLIRASREQQKLAMDRYAEAEALLLAELGLDAAQTSEVFETSEVSYTQDFRRARAAGRLDAEYFQPRYRQAMEVLGRSGKTIADVAELAKRRFEPQPGKPFQYIEIGDVGQAGYAESQTVAGEEAPSRAQWIVKAGDVITSTVRPIRRLSALIEPEQDGYVCSSGFVVLRPTTIEPEVLLVYLRLPIVCEILDLHTSASMYPAISTTDLLNLPVPLVSDQVCAKAVGLIQESRTSRQEARRLLEDAKRRVEEMVLGREG